MENVFGVQVTYFDYHGDSRSAYWRYPDEIEHYVTAEPEDMEKWLDHNNARIVSQRICEYEDSITAIEGYIAKNDRKNALIDEMTHDRVLELGLTKVDPSVNERHREDIRKLRTKIERLETSSLEEIYKEGLVEKWWIAIPIETKTIAEFDAELDK